MLGFVLYVCVSVPTFAFLLSNGIVSLFRDRAFTIAVHFYVFPLRDSALIYIFFMLPLLESVFYPLCDRFFFYLFATAILFVYSSRQRFFNTFPLRDSAFFVCFGCSRQRFIF